MHKEDEEEKSPLGLTCPDTTQHFELFLKVPEEVGSLQLASWFGERMLKTAGWGDFHRGGRGGNNFHSWSKISFFFLLREIARR